jgi:hypothetical protein
VKKRKQGKFRLHFEPSSLPPLSDLCSSKQSPWSPHILVSRQKSWKLACANNSHLEFLIFFTIHVFVNRSWQICKGVGGFLRKTPRRGGSQQPHRWLKKFKKYKGGKKRHTMVAQSSPKMPKWHHSALKAWLILAWILGSRVDRRELMAFQVAIPTSTVATQACWRIFLEEYW